METGELRHCSFQQANQVGLVAMLCDRALEDLRRLVRSDHDCLCAPEPSSIDPGICLTKTIPFCTDHEVNADRFTGR